MGQKTESKSVSDLEKENRHLRRLLFAAHFKAGCYYDDGELQDGTERPFIDFKRDTPQQIEDALVERKQKHFEKLSRLFEELHNKRQR